MILVGDEHIAVFFYQDHETCAAAACALCPESLLGRPFPPPTSLNWAVSGYRCRWGYWVLGVYGVSAFGGFAEVWRWGLWVSGGLAGGLLPRGCWYVLISRACTACRTRCRIDLRASARLILDVLARYRRRAVFFVVGRIVEEHPGGRAGDCGRRARDRAARIRPRDLVSYDAVPAGRLGEEPGQGWTHWWSRSRARGRAVFRAPYLLTPEFYRAEVYAMLRANGYHWVSNREIRYPVELLRPDRFPLRAAFRPGPGMLPGLVRSRLARSCSTRVSWRGRTSSVRPPGGCRGCSAGARRSSAPG